MIRHGKPWFALVVVFATSLTVSLQYIANIPPSHLPFYLRNNLDELEDCLLHSSCNITRESVVTSCWGYEPQCKDGHRFQSTSCPGDSNGWSNRKTEQKETFFKQADFGYLRDTVKYPLCKANQEHTSSHLECSSHLRFCRGRHILIDFSSLNNISEPMKYREDVIKEGQISGFGCDLDFKKLQDEGGHKSPLQSWSAEIGHFSVIKEEEYHSRCSVLITKPTFMTKLDATVNMYHHFCDFLNIYLTMHLNNSLKSLDRSNILIYDTMPYRSNFGISWLAFLKNRKDLLDLRPFKGKTVCFTDVVFSFLPRMVFGMYYNMPLIPGCHKSGLFKAFRQHMLHRLDITDDFEYKDINTGKANNDIRITIIVRNTRHRKILNLEELVKTLKTKSKRFHVKTIDFNHQMPFKDQLKVTANSDILVGMHGAGLSHVLFLPDYAVLFELFNCDDKDCYQDLSRLRGVEYLTWEDKSLVFPEDSGKHPTLGTPHPKFTNYAFDAKEFLRIILKAVKHVKIKRRDYARDTLGIVFEGDHQEL